MTVIEKDRLVFEVQGQTGIRTIDMAKYEGNGDCDCVPFRRDIRPQLEQHLKQSTHKPFEYVPEPRHQCPHIVAVNAHISNRLVQTIRNKFPDHEDVT